MSSERVSSNKMGFVFRLKEAVLLWGDFRQKLKWRGDEEMMFLWNVDIDSHLTNESFYPGVKALNTSCVFFLKETAQGLVSSGTIRLTDLDEDVSFSISLMAASLIEGI